MEITVGRPANDAEIDAHIDVQRRTWANTEDVADWRERLVLENTRIVRLDGRVVGGLTLIPMGQFFGGRSVPMTGIGGVGVDPAERSSGAASTLMREVIGELHTQGVALSVLYPATQPVYRRVGYELAGVRVGYSVPLYQVDVRDRPLDMERFEADALDRVRPIYEARARRTSGNLDRSPAFWERVIAPPKTELQRYVVSGPDGPEGYCVIAQNREGGWRYLLEMRDLVALTPRAARHLLAFSADHRSVAEELRWSGGPMDSLVYQLREQRWVQGERPIMAWMLRVVDVPLALRERGYGVAVDTEVAFEVADDVVPANNGRFVLRVAGGKGRVEEGGNGEVRIDIRGLAPLYTGFLGAEELRATGYVDGSEDALARATSVFAGPAPWLADFF